MTDKTQDAPAPAPAPEPGPILEPIYEGSSGLSINELGPAPPAALEPDPEPAAAPAPRADGKPEGYDQVDFQTDDRAKIEARFHRLYGQMKKQGQTLDQFATDNRALFEKINNFEVAQTNTNISQHLTSLQGQLQEAMDEGDATRVTNVVRQITQIEARTATAKALPPREEVERQVDAGPTGDEHPDVVAIQEFAAARPWAQEGHEHRSWAAFQLNDLYTNEATRALPVADKLAEVERRYNEYSGAKAAAPSAPKAPAVLDQGGHTPARTPANGKLPALSTSQKAVAVRMFPEKKVEEALASYARGLL